MTLQVPRWLIAVVALALAAGGGFVLAKALSDDDGEPVSGTAAQQSEPWAATDG